MTVAVSWWNSLADQVGDSTLLTCDEPLAPKTTMRVGGSARFYAEPESISDLSTLRRSAEAEGVPVFMLGRGSNLIVMDAGFEGLVIRLNGDPWQRISVEGDRLEAMSGARLKQICAAAAAAGLAGFEFLEGIPGTLGGSLRMNAGAMGGWIFDRVESVTCLESDASVDTHPSEFFHPAYRSCPELRNRFALGARLRASGPKSTSAIREQINAYSQSRKLSQPREPSAGCIFKNPENGYAGKLIEELGLKGANEGSAMVSPVHGNFIVNMGGAKADDVLRLIRRIRSCARDRIGVTLEPEALLLGARWEDVL